MTAIEWVDVVVMPGASSLSSVDEDAQDLILAYVNGDGVAYSKFDGEDGTTTKLARCYLAAHLAALGQRGAAGGVGPVTQMSEGGVSVSYAQPSYSQVEASLGDTPFGKAFSALIQRNPKLRGFLVA